MIGFLVHSCFRTARLSLSFSVVAFHCLPWAFVVCHNGGVDDERWLTADEVVARYGLKSRAALYAMRSRGTGPRGYRIGRLVKFKVSDLLAWEATRADRERTTG